MKTNVLTKMLLMAFVAMAGLAACSDDDGDWDQMKWIADTAMGKDHTISVPMEGGTYQFTCANYPSFWFSGFRVDGKPVDYDYEDIWHLRGEWITADVENNVLTVTVLPNTAENSRTAKIGVTAGDIFDGFTFHQAGQPAGPETPDEEEVKSEADIEYYDKCPFGKYAMDTEMTVDRAGNIFGSAGSRRPSYEMCRMHLENVLDKADPNWEEFSSVPYMARYAYVFSPLSSEVRLADASGGGPMLKDLIPAEEFSHITSRLAEGEELEYVLVLANIHKKGLQRFVLTIRKRG